LIRINTRRAHHCVGWRPSWSHVIEDQIGNRNLCFPSVSADRMNEGEKGRPSRVSALMVAQLANDLRNLLTVMAGGLDSIRDSVPSGSEADKRLDELDGAIDGAFHVSRELLALVRPNPDEPGVSDVNEVVMQARSVIERMLGTDIRLFVELAAEAPFVQADAVQLEWLLLNLAANAADAMPNGGFLQIQTADTSPRDDSGRDRYLRLTATDTGRAMSTEAQERAFEPFFSTKLGGTGLGLTSVVMTVRRLNGWLEMKHRRRGTKIDIYLPALGPKRG
jgi:two-component system cell cycle sensor histidine kinase/response regulator CckA